MQISVVWKAQAAGHPKQEKMQAVMMLMMTCLVELSQSLLEVVELLLCLVEQLVMTLVEYSKW